MKASKALKSVHLATGFAIVLALLSFEIGQWVVLCGCLGYVIQQFSVVILDQNQLRNPGQKLGTAESVKKSRGVSKYQVALWSVMLPLGASLYTLVDFFNAYKVIGALGYLSTFTLMGCVGLGLLSWTQKIQLWGYNVCRYLHQENPKQTVDQNYSWFTKFYYFSAQSRRVLNYMREIALTILDVCNNIFSYAFVNQLSMALIGYSVSIYFLHLCTVASFMNRMVIFHFQSAPDAEAIVSKDFSKRQAEPSINNIEASHANQTKKSQRQPS